MKIMSKILINILSLGTKIYTQAHGGRRGEGEWSLQAAFDSSTLTDQTAIFFDEAMFAIEQTHRPTYALWRTFDHLAHPTFWAKHLFTSASFGSWRGRREAMVGDGDTFSRRFTSTDVSPCSFCTSWAWHHSVIGASERSPHRFPSLTFAFVDDADMLTGCAAFVRIGFAICTTNRRVNRRTDTRLLAEFRLAFPSLAKCLELTAFTFVKDTYSLATSCTIVRVGLAICATHGGKDHGANAVLFSAFFGDTWAWRWTASYVTPYTLHPFGAAKSFEGWTWSCWLKIVDKEGGFDGRLFFGACICARCKHEQGD